ncbi:MAG: phospholipase D-like domain-containing protein [Myxococcota bacterium]
MTPDRVDPILLETFEDHRLSRAERRRLQRWLEEEGIDDDGRAYVRHRAFEIAEKELARGDSASVLQWLEGVVKACAVQVAPAEPKRSAVYFSPGPRCLETIVGLLREAKRTIDICVFTITDDRVTKEIIAAHRRVTVRVITDDDKSLDRGSDVEKLERAGVPVRMDQSEHHMHHKFALFDQRVVLTGSYNWTRSAQKHNRENIAVSEDPKLIRGYHQGFETLWTDLR